MNPAILNIEVQEYIQAHLSDDISRLLFKGSPFPQVSAKELVEQIESKRASEKKLPTLFNTAGIYFPKKLSIEQTSSEATAQYKSTLIKGERVVDLTGGLGIDTFFFSKKAKSVTHCEIDPTLSAIAKHNAQILGEENVNFVVGNGMEFLKESSKVFDTIYIDPSRRKTDKRVFLLSDCEPDVVENLNLLLSKASRIIVKTSPLLDIQSGLRQLENVSQIHIVSVKNDCKEVLWILDQNYEGEPEIVCVAINEGITQKLSFRPSEEKIIQIERFFQPDKYLYEPDVSLMKGGCFKLITKKFKVQKLAPNTHLYTSKKLEDGFVGKTFSIIHTWSYKDFTRLKDIVKANVISRNFPSTPEEIKKKHKLKDGGDEYLIFTSGPSGNLLTIYAKRI